MEERKKISLLVAIVVGINAMIGAGIVAIPGMLSQQAGPGGTLSFVLSILVVLAMSSSLGALAKAYPGKGWNYLYPSQYGGHTLGMISALCYLAGVIVAMGFLVQQAGEWSGNFLPGWNTKILGGSILLGLTLTVLVGVEASSFGQYLIAGVVVCSLFIASAACLMQFNVDHWHPFFPKGQTAVLTAAPMAMFSFLGFESIASLYSILRDPEKNVRKACVYSVLVVGAIYLLFVIAIISAVPAELFQQGDQVTLPLLLRNLFPQYGFLSTLVLVGGLFAIIGTLHSMIWSIAVLWKDVFERARSAVMRRAIKAGFSGHRVGVTLPPALMLVIALILDSEMVLFASVSFIAVSYVLSITLLLLKRPFRLTSPSTWVTLFAILGGILLLVTALLRLFGSL